MMVATPAVDSDSEATPTAEEDSRSFDIRYYAELAVYSKTCQRRSLDPHGGGEYNVYN